MSLIPPAQSHIPLRLSLWLQTFLQTHTRTAVNQGRHRAGGKGGNPGVKGRRLERTLSRHNDSPVTRKKEHKPHRVCKSIHIIDFSLLITYLCPACGLLYMHNTKFPNTTQNRVFLGSSCISAVHTEEQCFGLNCVTQIVPIHSLTQSKCRRASVTAK